MSINFKVFFILFFWAVLFLILGFYSAFYSFSAMEMNDRIKYEAAYLNGYLSAQKMIKSKEYAKAEETIDFLIDAHLQTLREFEFLESSILSEDIGSVICAAAQFRESHPRINKENIDETWHINIDKFLKTKIETCG